MMPSSNPDALASVGADASVEVRVLLFSVLREHIGSGTVAVKVSAPATGHMLLDQLVEQYPVLLDYRPVVRLAVNQQYAALDTLLHEGDEVALITPVSGG